MCHNASTVQPGKAMTVKEMGAATATRRPFRLHEVVAGVTVSKKTTGYEFKISDGQLYDLALKAILECGYTLLTQNRSDGMITFKTGITWSSWSGVEIGALISDIGDNSAEIEFGGGTIVAAGNRPRQLAVIGNAVRGPARKVAEAIYRAIQKGEIPPARPLTPPSPGTFSMADEIKKLAELRAQGILSESEFNEGKKKLLANP
jgi:hypothetical protein